MARLPKLPKDNRIAEMLDGLSKVRLTTQRIVRLTNSDYEQMPALQAFFTQTACSPKLARIIAETPGVDFKLVTSSGMVDITGEEFGYLMGAFTD